MSHSGENQGFPPQGITAAAPGNTASIKKKAGGVMRSRVEICGINTAKLPVLKNDEMTALLRRAHAGDSVAREQLICGNLRLVLAAVKRFAGRSENVDDLFQVGCIGLMKSIDAFDLSYDVRLSSYSLPMIIGEIRRYLRDNSAIRVSRSMRDTAYKVLQSKERLIAQTALKAAAAQKGYVEKGNKKLLLPWLIKNLQPPVVNALVFSRTKHGADKITRVLEKAGIKCAAIHGNKSQNRRQEALGNFKCEQIRVLVATDIAARGIDVDDVSHVFNYDLPDVPETFVHRIGRTARAGKDGIAISFCAPDEEQDLRAIEKLTRISIPEGDKSIFEKLPPPQKETPESEMRNARGRGFPQGNRHGNKQNRGGQNRHENRDRRENQERDARDLQNAPRPQQNASHPKQKHQKPQNQQKSQNQQKPQNREKPNGGNPQNQEGRRTIGRNRPGSRARKRMREEAARLQDRSRPNK